MQRDLDRDADTNADTKFSTIYVDTICITNMLQLALYDFYKGISLIYRGNVHVANSSRQGARIGKLASSRLHFLKK